MGFVFNSLRSSSLITFLVFVQLVLSPLSPAIADRPTEPFDHSLWQQFLDRFVDESGKVHFAAVKEDPALLNQYLSQIERLSPSGFFSDWPREERLALFLNVYHAGLVKLVIEKYPVESIQEIPGIWDVPAVSMGVQADERKTFSLNDLRTAELVDKFEDEKIHTALSCGAESCPPFPRQAYTGPKVEGQLFVAARNFVNDPDFIRITPGEKKIFLSRILKWYAKDFTLDFGQFDDEEKGKLTSEEKAVLSFVAYYLGDAQKLRFLEERNYRVDYLPFDWSLNDASPAPSKA
jgi:hypothetical protein